MAGKLVVQRGNKKSSVMALDQSQEHSTQFLKEGSGAKGVYGQQESKEVIELCKPEVLRAIDEFVCACFSASTPNESLEHPESLVDEHKKFIKHLTALCDLVGTVVNPFNETNSELITLDTGEVMDPDIVDCLKNAPSIGTNMFTEFVTDRIEEVTIKNRFTF